MSALGRISNSIFSGTNENTLALASINIDFSLLKFEAPREYARLGTALSHRRRQDAEEGPLHQTARKLGALFEKKIPSAPSLIKAYGSRASAIFEMPGVNPRGSRSDGAFESFVGVDGTSIWAAATSGSAAIAMHLLACMLARMWPAKEATSIWAELLIERKREIEVAAKKGDVSSMTISLTGALSVSRDDLRLWDASAHSWLQSADAAKFSEQKRLELILKNVNVPIASGTSTYNKVLSAWTHAMNGLELLTTGVPQRICDGGILVALTAWHIFPDLLVLGQKTVNVQFRDPLIPRSGVITIGLHSSLDEERETGIKWSLALSHLCYYGDPIEVASDELKSRVTMEQLQLVAFGSLLWLWEFPSHEANLVAGWLIALWTQIQKAPIEALGNGTSLHQSMSWLWVLVLAAQKLLGSHGEELEINLMLVKWGYRRGKTFLGAKDNHVPLFGLSNLPVLSALTESSDLQRDIKYLREVAKLIGASSDDSIITVRPFRTDPFVLVSAVPHTLTSQKRSSDGESKETAIHARWVSKYYDTSRVFFCIECDGDCGRGCAFATVGLSCGWEGHKKLSNDRIHCGALQESSRNRISLVSSKAEFSSMHVDHGECYQYTCGSSELIWQDPPLLYTEAKRGECRLSSENQAKMQLPCNCFDPSSAMCSIIENPDQKNRHSLRVAYFDTIVGSDGHSALHLRRCMPRREYPTVQECLNSQSASCNIERATEWITRLDPSGLLEFFHTIVLGAESWRSVDSCKPTLLCQKNFLPSNLLQSLQALSISHRLYESLPGATIPLQVTSLVLHEAKWMNLPSNGEPPAWPMPRSNAFSCISMFETGTLNISPSSLQSVMAMSLGNSIYISAALLSDPTEGGLAHHIKRITGNVGLAGIVMMIPPQPPRIRELRDDFRAVQHARYNFQREDNFEGTTLHLSFTEWKLPIDIGSYGTIEQDVCFVESVISVHDRGDWVADLDILAANRIVFPLELQCKCTEVEKMKSQKLAIAKRFISIDCWEELLDAPDGTGIFRARGNWAARLAAVAILARRGIHKAYIVGTHMPCLQCLSELSEKDLAGSFFID